MIAWPIPRAAQRRSKRLSGPWHRDGTAAAHSIARWEDDGGRVNHLAKPAARPLSTGGTPSPPDARQS